MRLRDDWPLVLYTLLLPASWTIYLFYRVLPADLDIAGPAALAMAWVLAATALLGAPFHLGHPWRAPLALTHLSRSWLSRQIALSAIFFLCLSVPMLEPLVQIPLGSLLLTGVTLCAGLLSILAGASAFAQPGRPGWHFEATLAQFVLSGFALGAVISVTLTSIALLQSPLPSHALRAALNWGIAIAGLSIATEAALTGWHARHYAADAGRLPGHSAPATVQRYSRLGAVFSALALVLALIVGLWHPDTLLLIGLVVLECGAAWCYRLAFFLRGRPLSVPALVSLERQRRLETALQRPAPPSTEAQP